MFLGIDTGGTFTDFVCFGSEGVRFHKVLSTPENPSQAIFQGVRELGLDFRSIHLVHGSTVATNAILERKGVKTLFVTHKGLEDLITIGRQTRLELFELCPEAPELWLEGRDSFGVAGRMDADGCEIQAMETGELTELSHKARDYDAVAVCLLFSFLNKQHEIDIAKALPEHVYTSLSHQVVAEYREYERAATTFLNAYVGPLVQSYLRTLAGELDQHLYVMHSAGGVISADEAGEQAVRLVLSGPAGGLVAAEMVGKQLGLEKILTFDMGGTSTDVAMLDGKPGLTTEGSIAGVPVSVPMLDIHTIGAGGGSLAWLDSAGLPQVGPESAGASPGPACYGQGGKQPTVTDANVVLGRIPANAALAGSMALNIKEARAAVGLLAGSLAVRIEEAALGIVQIAEEHMAGALRVASVQKGRDPKDFALLCFGGAGGLHACAVADRMGMKQVVFPVAGGAFSALGMLAGRRQSEFSRSRRLSLAEAQTPDEVQSIFDELKGEAQARMPGLELNYACQLDLRYEGQGFHLTLNYEQDVQKQAAIFEAAHISAYGHKLDRRIEIMTMRLSAFADTPTITLPEMATGTIDIQPVGTSEVYGHGRVVQYQRSQLQPGIVLPGPALVLESTATLWLAVGWQLSVSVHGHLSLEKVG